MNEYKIRKSKLLVVEKMFVFIYYIVIYIEMSYLDEIYINEINLIFYL